MTDDLVKRLWKGIAGTELQQEAADRIKNQATAIDAAIAELDASPIMNARICEAKRLLRAACEAKK